MNRAFNILMELLATALFTALVGGLLLILVIGDF